MSNSKEKYSLFTAISMIVGICVGSGIFFKAEGVLRATNGNVTLGIIIFIVGAFGIIFGSLSLSELAYISKIEGGIVGYFEEFVSPKIASSFAWFQVLLYFPTINVVVVFVAGIYTLQILGIEYNIEKVTFLGTMYLLGLFLLNYISMRFGGFFQRVTTIIKLIPLVLIATIALLGIEIHAPNTSVNIVEKNIDNTSYSWLAALVPMAFSYEGWTVILNISNEIKNGKRNVPLALIIGPVVVLIAYLSYFLGLIKILGVNQVLSLGNESIYYLGNQLFGEYGGVIIMLFILISVLGVSNGLTMCSIRMPELMASKGMVTKRLKPNTETNAIRFRSLVISLIISFTWIVVHYVTQRLDLFNGGDISGIAITFSYVCYIFLYIKILIFRKNKVLEKNFKNGIAPILGIVSSTVILIGSVIASPLVTIIFMGFSFLICILGYLVQKSDSSIE